MSESYSLILVVEDEAMIRMTISDYLRSCGFTVIDVGSADEDFALQSGIPANLVFSDVQMPGDWTGLHWRNGFASINLESRSFLPPVMQRHLRWRLNCAKKARLRSPMIISTFSSEFSKRWRKANLNKYLYKQGTDLR